MKPCSSPPSGTSNESCATRELSIAPASRSRGGSGKGPGRKLRDLSVAPISATVRASDGCVKTKHGWGAHIGYALCT